MRGPSGTQGFADNGSVFRFEFNENNPQLVSTVPLAPPFPPPPLPLPLPPPVAPPSSTPSRNTLSKPGSTSGGTIW